jgi:sugar phosphate isomerase/epimerase
VLPGTGQMPLGELFALLRTQKFGGVVSLESEKMWHPYLPDQREHLAHLQSQEWFKGSPALAKIS